MIVPLLKTVVSDKMFFTSGSDDLFIIFSKKAVLDDSSIGIVISADLLENLCSTGYSCRVGSRERLEILSIADIPLELNFPIIYYYISCVKKTLTEVLEFTLYRKIRLALCLLHSVDGRLKN
ncbi:hypothetical protein NQ317_004558 [Molorchus minor]|uniref:Uncharacterized protein n=1 Tax=Molorchus minor TaxID=1323400 RepID=A0ABQ9JY64_9CUCU|nr:hypothetical protein NQ317_004558 [Molorchus minor]